MDREAAEKAGVQTGMETGKSPIGIKGHEVTISLKMANYLSFVILLISALAAGLAWMLRWNGLDLLTDVLSEDFNLLSYMLRLLGFIVLVFLGLAVHELIHGLTWAVMPHGHWKSIRFGVIWKALTPYCHCSVPLGLLAYVTGALMPFLMLGVLPALMGVILGQAAMACFGVIFISGATGDLMVVWALRHEKARSRVLDHPEKAGCIVLED